MCQCIKFILFWNDTLHVSDGLSVHHQEFKTVHTGVFPGGKGGRCVRLTTLPPSCAVVTKSGSLNFLEPSGPLPACNGTDLPFYLLPPIPHYISLIQIYNLWCYIFFRFYYYYYMTPNTDCYIFFRFYYYYYYYYHHYMNSNTDSFNTQHHWPRSNSIEVFFCLLFTSSLL